MKGKKRPEIIEEAGPPPVTENLTPFGIGMEARKLRGACRRTRTLPPKEIRSTSTEKEAEPLDSPIAASLPVPGHLSPLPSSSSASASASARGRVYIRRRRLLLLGLVIPSPTDGGRTRSQTHRVGRCTPCRTEPRLFWIGFVADAPALAAHPGGPTCH